MREVVVVKLLEALGSEVEVQCSAKGGGEEADSRSMTSSNLGGGPPSRPVCTKRPGLEQAAWKYLKQLVVAAPMSLWSRTSLSPVTLPLARTW